MKTEVTIEIEIEDERFEESIYVDLTATVEANLRGYDDLDNEIEYDISTPEWPESEYTTKENNAIEKYIINHEDELNELFYQKFERDENN